MLFNKVKERILQNKQLKKEGKFVGIPMPFKRLSEYIPLIERGHSIGLLGATGSGKSRVTRYMFLYHPYKFSKENNYPLRIIYFPLEDNKEKVYRNLICHYLYDIYGIRITLQELDSKGDRELPDFVQEKIEEAKEFFADFEKIVTMVDGIHTPTEIFNYCQDYALSTGKPEPYFLEVEGKQIKQSRYIPNNNVHTIIIVDNLSNIDIEEGAEDERKAIVKFGKKLVRERLCNFFNFTVVQVLQQDFASERQSFNRDGNSIIAKLEPNLAAIGDSKTVARSMHLVFGLFHPARFEILQYPIPSRHDPQNTYRLDILGNRFRSLSILKANDTDFGMKIAINFDAITEVMTELPRPKTPEIEALYNKIKLKHPEKFTSVKNVIIQEEPDEEEPPF